MAALQDHLANALDGFSTGTLLLKDCVATPALFLVQLLVKQALHQGRQVLSSCKPISTSLGPLQSTIFLPATGGAAGC